MLRLLLLCLVLALSACSDDDDGKEIGEPCLAHSECASGLCTISVSDDAGTSQKTCQESALP